MLRENEFKLLKCLYERQPCPSQRKLAAETGLSLATVNNLLKKLQESGCLTADSALTEAGIAQLEPYRVKNAVIMAAGSSSRFAPLSYEKPKGLLRVKGEILIEREIRQLQEAGITDITLIVGYMKEKFFYLTEKLGVDIVVNEDYYRYNNPSSLMQVLDRLDNTYVCSSDDYFTENVFERYVYDSYYAAAYTDRKTEEYCLRTDRRGRITGVTIGGGPDAWFMIGHVYFSRSFSQTFVPLLRREYEARAAVREHLWENFLMEHLRELPIYIRRYDEGIVHEFDSLDELRAFDDRYLNNTDSSIFENITATLRCGEADIRDIVPIKEGLTNTSFRFTVNGASYVYRHPGQGTSAYIHRDSESASMEVARRLGLDDTFITMDAQKGWKISHYVENSRILDYNNENEVRRALSMMRTLHDAKLRSAYDFDIWRQALGFVERIREKGRSEFEDFTQLLELIGAVYAFASADGVEKRLCHCDCYAPNFLIDEQEKMYLIDWEYSGNDDPGCDYGTFICCSEYTEEEAEKVLELYYGRPLTPLEKRHSFAYIAISSYYWFVWALYQDSQDKPVGRYLYLWYKAARRYGKKALALYKEEN